MEYNPLLVKVQDDPYPYYAYMRRQAPVYWVEPLHAWAVSRYDDVFFVQKNPQLFSSSNFFALVPLEDKDPTREGTHIIASDPPAHTRLRKLANRAFTPRIIQALELHIREIVSELLDRMEERGSCDVMTDLAMPLPIIVIAELLGVERERREDFRRWTDAFVRIAGGLATGEDLDQLHQDMGAMHIYFQQMIEVRRKAPKADFISALIQAQDEEQRLTAGEVFNLATFVLIAGNETTRNLIGNTTLALLQNQQELAKVHANPALLPALVEEGLRYDSPIQVVHRLAVQDVEVAGTMIRAGTPVLVLVGSANRDERMFADPDRFDVTRSNAQDNIAFGFGIHFCLGAPLARLEGRIALEMMLARFPRLAQRDEPIEKNSVLYIQRGLNKLPVTCGDG